MNYLNPLLKVLDKLPEIGWTLLLGYAAILVAKTVFSNFLRVVKVNVSVRQVLESGIGFLLWVFLVIAVINAAGLKNLALALSSSVAIIGVAIGAGANSLISDIIAGLYLAKDRDFGIGCKVKSGDIEGTVKKIDVRKVRIQGDDGKIHVVPNSKFDKEGWTSLTKEE